MKTKRRINFSENIIGSNHIKDNINKHVCKNVKAYSSFQIKFFKLILLVMFYFIHIYDSNVNSNYLKFL